MLLVVMAWFRSPFLTILRPKMILRKRLYNQLQRVNNTKSGEIWLSFFLFNQWSHGLGLVVRSDPMYDGEVYHINKKLRHLIAKDRGLLVVLLILTWGWYRHSLLPALKKSWNRLGWQRPISQEHWMDVCIHPRRLGAPKFIGIPIWGIHSPRIMLLWKQYRPECMHMHTRSLEPPTSSCLTQPDAEFWMCLISILNILGVYLFYS